MQSYCLGRKQHIDHIGSKKINNNKKAIREKLRCTNYMVDKSRFLKQKHN